ncbi:MAG: hypothetical protein U0935_03790 [Pirellulales bacterium]
MAECWLRPNPRAVWPLLVLPVLAVAGGLAVLLWTVLSGQSWYLRLAAAIPPAVAAAMLVTLIRWSRLPRLACDDGELLVYLDGLTPARIPLDVVECFFGGQSDALLPGPTDRPVRTAAVIVRLAEAASAWQQRPVRPSLGKWADGYITLRGTWCEPITPALLKDLNARLVAAQRVERARTPPCSSEGCAS